jgi:hypothetical protein
MGLFDRIFGGKEKGGLSPTAEEATAVVPVAPGVEAEATAVVAAPDTATATGVELQQVVLVRFAYRGDELGPLFELQHRLEVVVEAARLGEVDGQAVAMDGSDGVLCLYGPDADALFVAARPVLESAAFMKAARVTIRYGGAVDGVREKDVVLGA